MKRLTKRIPHLATLAVNEMGYNYIQVDDMDEAMEKLSSYEDTGLDPEEIEELRARGEVQKMYKSSPNTYCCPACGEEIAPMRNYCPWCGQHVID